MCAHDDTVMVNVPIAAHLSHEGEMTWKVKPVDRCIAPLVDALNAAGIYTLSSCCGHFQRRGQIPLMDGREIIVAGSYFDGERASRLPPFEPAAAPSTPPSDDDLP